jgi:hypothetical protein
MFYERFPNKGGKFGTYCKNIVVPSSNLDGGGAVFCLHAPLLPSKVGVLATGLVHGGPEADGVVRGGRHKEVRRHARRVDTARFQE